MEIRSFAIINFLHVVGRLTLWSHLLRVYWHWKISISPFMPALYNFICWCRKHGRGGPAHPVGSLQLPCFFSFTWCQPCGARLPFLLCCEMCQSYGYFKTPIFSFILHLISKDGRKETNFCVFFISFFSIEVGLFKLRNNSNPFLNC